MIDKNLIMNTIGCDEDFLNELFDKFISESKKSMSLMNEAAANDNWPVVKGAAHKTLSSTRIFEMNELTSLLKDIEIMAQEDGDKQNIHTLIATLNKKIEKVYEELKQ